MSENNFKGQIAVVLLVVGDIGRSPRMIYHAKSILKSTKHKSQIHLIGYTDSPIPLNVFENAINDEKLSKTHDRISKTNYGGEIDTCLISDPISIHPLKHLFIENYRIAFNSKGNIFRLLFLGFKFVGLTIQLVLVVSRVLRDANRRLNAEGISLATLAKQHKCQNEAYSIKQQLKRYFCDRSASPSDWESIDCVNLSESNENNLVLILQNPPGFPAMPVCIFCCWLFRANLIIDWHNTTASMLISGYSNCYNFRERLNNEQNENICLGSKKWSSTIDASTGNFSNRMDREKNYSKISLQGKKFLSPLSNIFSLKYMKNNSVINADDNSNSQQGHRLGNQFFGFFWLFVSFIWSIISFVSIHIILMIQLIWKYINGLFKLFCSSLSFKNILIRLMSNIEFIFGYLASGGFCVSNLMRKHLLNYGIDVVTLYDRPASALEPITIIQRHRICQTYLCEYQKNCQNYDKCLHGPGNNDCLGVYETKENMESFVYEKKEIKTLVINYDERFERKDTKEKGDTQEVKGDLIENRKVSSILDIFFNSYTDWHKSELVCDFFINNNVSLDNYPDFSVGSSTFKFLKKGHLQCFVDYSVPICWKSKEMIKIIENNGLWENRCPNPLPIYNNDNELYEKIRESYFNSDVLERYKNEWNIVYTEKNMITELFIISKLAGTITKNDDLDAENGHDNMSQDLKRGCDCCRIFCIVRKKRPCVLITATSYTADEDLSLMFDALEIYSDVRSHVLNNIHKESLLPVFPRKISAQRDKMDLKSVDDGGDSTNIFSKKPDDRIISLPPIVVVVTGRGEGKSDFIEEAKRRNFGGISFITLFAPINEYYQVVAASDLGLSLHISSSDVDLPMKILDYYGAGLPTLGVWFPSIVELMPLAQTFRTAEEFANMLVTLLEGFPNDFERSSVFDSKALDVLKNACNNFNTCLEILVAAKKNQFGDNGRLCKTQGENSPCTHKNIRTLVVPSNQLSIGKLELDKTLDEKPVHRCDDVCKISHYFNENGHFKSLIYILRLFAEYKRSRRFFSACNNNTKFAATKTKKKKKKAEENLSNYHIENTFKSTDKFKHIPSNHMKDEGIISSSYFCNKSFNDCDCKWLYENNETFEEIWKDIAWPVIENCTYNKKKLKFSSELLCCFIDFYRKIICAVLGAFIDLLSMLNNNF